MKALLYIFCLLFLNLSYAKNEDNNLQITRQGLTVVVVNFKEGDKIKLFEVETGDHVLSKTRGELDLSQLPSGAYLLENNEGKSVVIEKTDDDIIFDEELGTEYVVQDSEVGVIKDITLGKELEDFYIRRETNPLYIERDGDLVIVTDFEEGDVIKLFELKNTVHVLSKTVGVVDLSQLPSGKYVLENNKGQSVIINKQHIEDNYFAE